MILREYYLQILKDNIKNTDDEIFSRHGKSKELILQNNGCMDNEKDIIGDLWYDFQKNIEFGMDHDEAFQETMINILHIPSSELAEQKIDGWYYYQMKYFWSRYDQGVWVVKSDERYSDVTSNCGGADEKFLNYLVDRGFLDEDDASHVQEIQPVKRYEFELFFKDQIYKRKDTDMNENKKFQVCGFQFPGEEALNPNSLRKLLKMISSYYIDVIRIDEENTATCAYFVIDPDLYNDWLIDGTFDEFTRFIREIISDVNKENENNIYRFHDIDVFLGYD